MYSKEILETLGISKKFNIVLSIQTILLIIGCFLAIIDMYFKAIGEFPIFIIADLCVLVLLFALIHYSFIGFNKEEKHFRIITYLYLAITMILVFVAIRYIMHGANPISLLYQMIKLCLLFYFAYYLDENYNKSKIAILILIIFEVITWLTTCHINGLSILSTSLKVIYVIPAISVALNYLARYNEDGFKQIDK